MQIGTDTVNRISSPEIAQEIITDYLSELPHFLEKITGLEEYVQKVLTFGHMYVIKKESVTKGFIIFYSNDMQSYTAYVSLIVVSKEYRRQNVGTKLLDICETVAKNGGMKYIRLEVDRDNDSARRFYENLGFVITEEEEERSFYMRKEI